MTKRAATSDAVEVEKKVKKEEPKDETPSLKEKLGEGLTREEILDKLVEATTELETLRAKLKRTQNGEHIARIRYTLKDKEHRLLAQDRCNARWKLLGDSPGIVGQRRGLQMEAFVHDTLLSQRDEIHGLKKDLDSAKSELNTLRGKASEENSKEWERSKKLKEENDKLRGDAKKKAEVEKQLAISQKANSIYKAKFKEFDKELSERNSRIRQLEEAPRAEDEEEDEDELVEDVEGEGEGEKDDDESGVKEEEGREAAAEDDDDEGEELMLDDGHEEEEEAKAEE